jgi:hypothetical protein
MPRKPRRTLAEKWPCTGAHGTGGMCSGTVAVPAKFRHARHAELLKPSCPSRAQYAVPYTLAAGKE